MPYKDPEKRRELSKKHYEANKTNYATNKAKLRKKKWAWLREYKKDKQCKECGENHPACLCFHHRDPAQKEMGIAVMVNRCFSIERILAEIAKCDVYCLNCHAKLHHEADN